MVRQLAVDSLPRLDSRGPVRGACNYDGMTGLEAA